MHTMSPGTKLHNKKNFTEFMYVNPNKAHLQLPQLVECDKITLPDNWILEKLIKPEPIVNSHISNISQTPSGLIQINFQPQRKSTSIASSSSVLNESKQYFRSNSFRKPDLKFKWIIEDNQIPKAIYEKDRVTHSEMEFDKESNFEINTITTIDLYINKISKISCKEFLED